MRLTPEHEGTRARDAVRGRRRERESKRQRNEVMLPSISPSLVLCVSSPSHRSTSSRSYTLIEILLVVAILGMCGALLIPHLAMRDVMKVQSAVRLVIGDLSFAQADALAHQEYRRIHFYDDGRGYCIVRINNPTDTFDESATNHDYIRDPLARPNSDGWYIVDFVNDPRFGEITITSVAIDGTSRNLTFDALGGTVGPAGSPGVGGTIVIGSASESYEITVAPFTGKLTVRQL